MRFLSTIFCAVLLLLNQAAHAQGDYNAQKAKLKPAGFDSITELRVVARNYLGKVVELRGEVKGTFTRGDNMALLFQVASGENIVIEAPPSFKSSSATRPGATSRLLCRVDGSSANDVSLTLVNASDAPAATQSSQLFKVDDGEVVAAPPNGGTLPQPDEIMIGPDATLTPIQAIAPTGTRRPSAPASRSMGVGAIPQRRGAQNPYYGFDDSQRAAFKNLARRNNPRLADDMADYIAASILSAAQTHSLDPRFLAAVVKVESSFDPYCLSGSGAMGLGQLMPFNLRPLGVGNAWDPMQNLSGAAKMLRRNLDTYAGQPNGTLLAVAAYHAGVGAVNKAGKQVPARAATQKYVWKVYYAYRDLAPELFH